MDPLMLKQFLSGAILVSAWTICLFFLRFRKRTGDRLFAFFAASFFLFGVERIANLIVAGEFQPAIYLIRLTAFLVIIFGIVDKNRSPTT